MSTSTDLGSAICHAAPNPAGSCNACQRKGLPILPLRAAYAPQDSARDPEGVDDAKKTLATTPMGMDRPRTLRQGYLYVLLDQQDWQAYQVTPEGHLRQFRPLETPREAPQSLCQACIQQDHDVPASFIHIDTEKYATAWIAFSSDPWTPSVLERYQHGVAANNALAARFCKLDLQTARNAPQTLGIAMDPNVMYGAVDIGDTLEYSAAHLEHFSSVHGFSPRRHRKTALDRYIREQYWRHKLEKGVLALTLPDPVGQVQEINHHRLAWQRQLQAYEARQNYPLYTSEALKQIRTLSAQAAKDEATSRHHLAAEARLSPADGPPVFGDPGRELAEQVQRKTKQSLARLDERYDEARRARWEKDYEATKALIQKQVDKLAQLYTERLGDTLFRLIERNDYDDGSPYSVGCYIQSMEACLRGGITEARPTPNADGSPPPLTGPSAKAWQGWIQDGKSIVYQTLLARNKSLLQAFVPSLNKQGELDWNDSEKIYSAVTKVIGSSDLGEHLLQPKIQEAIASVQSAYNDAAGRLGQAVDLGVDHVTARLNSATLLLYTHIHTAQLMVRMTIGEYYKLMNEVIGDRLQKSAASMDKVPTKVRSVLAGGVLSLALSDPKLAEKIFPVVLWVQDSAEALSKHLGSNALAQAQHGASQTAQQVLAQLGKLKVLPGTLQPGARKLLNGLQLHSAQAASLVRTSLSMGRSITRIGVGTVGKADLLFAVAGTYLVAEGMRKSIKTAEETLGSKHSEAITALYGAYVAVIGGSIEAMGLLMKNGATQAQKTLRLSPTSSNTVGKVAKAGKQLAQYGVIIGAVGGYFDAVVAYKASSRSKKAGDGDASDIYIYSAILSGLSATVLGISAFAGSTAIFGPVGWGILLGLSAYAFYKWAEGKESSPLERWANFSYFGKIEEKLKWIDANTAVAALNAAVFGVDVVFEFETDIRVFQYPEPGITTAAMAILKPNPLGVQSVPQLTYQIVLPNYNALQVGYSWKLTVKRYSGAQVLASGHHPSQPIASPVATPHHTTDSQQKRNRLDYDPQTVLPILQEKTITAADGSKSCFLLIQGAIDLHLGHDIDSAEVYIEYFPNINDKDMLAKVEIKKQK